MFYFEQTDNVVKPDFFLFWLHRFTVCKNDNAVVVLYPLHYPSPTDLIVKFLSITPDTKEAESKQSENESPESNKNEVPGNKRGYKFLALKILSLKVAAFLKWDLGILERRLPLPMQLTLLQDLLYLTLEKDAEVETHLQLDLSSCPGHILFAVALYHRWVLRAVMSSRFATKQARQPYIPVPGLQDPTYVPPNVSEDLVRGLDSQVANSIEVLSRILAGPAIPTVPIFDTFVMLTEDSTDARQNWDKSAEVSSTEFLCQLHFDLGSFHFFREEYSVSGDLFRKAAELRQLLDIESTVYCTVSVEDLKGYCEACDITSPTVSTHNLTYQLHRAIRDQYTGIVSILQTDNVHREIPQIYRDTLELDIQGAMSSRKFTVARDLLLQVQTLNVVRRVVTGTLTCGDYTHKLHQGGSKAVDLLVSALKHILPHSDLAEKERIKLFVMRLIECGDIEGLPERLISYEFLTDLFSPTEMEEIPSKTAGVGHEVDIPELLLKTDWDMPDFTLCKNVRLEVGSLEQQLLLSYDVTEIRGLVEKLVAANPAKPQWRINNKWELPIPLQSMAMSLPRGFVQDFACILLAKSRELTTMKDFKLARDLLNAVGKEARNSSINSGVLYKLIRLLSWETLLIQIIEFLTEWPNHKLNTSTLVSDCKQCLAALQSGDNVIPRLEVMEHCAICLLNLGEWEYLIGLEKRWNYFEIAAAIACACLDIAKYKGNKKVSRDAWDIVLPIFGPNPQQKRTSSGTTTLVHRDSPNNSSTHTRSTLSHFLARLRDSTALAVVISLLARLQNVLRDEPSLELSVDYVGLWPAVVSNANSYSLRSVGETLSQLLLQALQFHATNVAWLKVMGDLNFVQGHHAVSLRYYLEAAIVVSDFFSQPVPRAAIDDHVYKRMIKCCSHLQCHTQAAVLCQFLEEVDYTTAFKSLGDIKSTCSDAMDSYYSCIWDTTILEYLVYLHTKRGEHHRKQQAIKVIGLLELNANNNEEIQREAANIRKSRFLRAMARQYVC
ncbi:integrator complex subunit 8 isoform X2 [Zootermopsis nevadensis]|uniref:integrator complex subunit 8 isoform X2 n=1 Tax=Zootermopsis nevadensis TaxID=136037 RepID=UPI000B8EB3C4|nr:integrator complex subunit 8 isoform X2 [Zootermopsis nevadensis]